MKNNNFNKNIILALSALFVLIGLGFVGAINPVYDLTTQFLVVKARNLTLTSVVEGSGTDSVLTKGANGIIYKVARSSFSGGGTVTSFGKTDNYGIISSVTNPTTTPIHTIGIDTALIRSVANSLSLAQLQTKFNGYVPTTRTVAGFALSSNVTLAVHTRGFGLTGVNYAGSAAQTWAVDTTIVRSVANSFTLSALQTKFNGYVPVTRTLTAGYGLIGLGALSTDLTVRVDTTNSSTGIQRKANMITSFGTPYNSTYAYPSAALVQSYVTSSILAAFGDMSNYLASGNGSSTTISITHGLSGITGTSKVIVQPLNAASAGIQYATVSSTTVSIIYTVAPATGTNNLSYTIHIKP